MEGQQWNFKFSELQVLFKRKGSIINAWSLIMRFMCLHSLLFTLFVWVPGLGDCPWRKKKKKSLLKWKNTHIYHPYLLGGQIWKVLMLKNFLPSFMSKWNRGMKLSCNLNYKVDCCKCYYSGILLYRWFYFHILCCILKTTFSHCAYLLMVNSFRISSLLIAKVYRKSSSPRMMW